MLSRYSWTHVQDAAVAILLPFDSQPEIVSQFCAELLPRIQTFPQHVQVGLALKYARTTVLSRSVDAELKKGPLALLCSQSPKIYQLPLLFLRAHSSDPTVLDLVITSERRYDTMLLYYSAVNKLLVGAPEQADADLMHAWALSKGAKDLRDSIVNALSLSAFLSRVPQQVFLGRIRQKYAPRKGADAEIWDLGANLEFLIGKWDSLFQRLAVFIRKEHARRVIANLAITADAIPLQDLRKLVGFTVLDDFLSPEAPFRVENGIVLFGTPNLVAAIETEIARIPAATNRRPR
jgi:hypothetical protein